MIALLIALATAAPAVRTISYETGPCFGVCPSYKVTVSSDGRGVFEGKRFTAVKGVRRFRIAPAQWRALTDRLRGLHGRGAADLTGPPLCEAMATDMPTVEVVWSGAWRPFTLRANYGCQTKGQGWMLTHLRLAPAALPIAAFIGRPGTAPR